MRRRPIGDNIRLDATPDKLRKHVSGVAQKSNGPGFASGRIPEYKANLALLKGSSMVGVFLGRFRKEEPSAYENNFAELFSLYEQGKLKPIVTESFAFEDYVAAFNVFTERKVMGKVTLEIKTEA